MLLDQISTTGKQQQQQQEETQIIWRLNPSKFKFEFNKIQSFYKKKEKRKKNKTSAKAVIGGTYLNIMKAKYDKTITNIIVNNEKLKKFALKSALRQCAHTHHYLFWEF